MHDPKARLGNPEAQHRLKRIACEEGFIEFEAQGDWLAIHMVFVKEDQRRKGIGTGLVQQAILVTGCKRLWWGKLSGSGFILAQKFDPDIQVTLRGDPRFDDFPYAQIGLDALDASM